MTSDPAAHGGSDRQPPGGQRPSVVVIATAISLIVAVALLVWRPSAALGFAGGALTGAGMLSALVVVLTRLVAPPQERTSHPALWIALHVTKFALAAALAYLVVIVLEGNLLAFAGGYTVALITLLISYGRTGHHSDTGGPTRD